MKNLALLFCFVLIPYQMAVSQTEHYNQPVKPYEPHMDALFAAWAVAADSFETVCAGQASCSGTIHRTEAEIPFRVQVQNTSSVSAIDKDDVAYLVRKVVFTQYDGFKGVESSAHTGPHRDTLVVSFALNNGGYRYKLQFNTGWQGEWIQGAHCSTGNNHTINGSGGVPLDQLPLEQAQEVWADLSLNDFTLGGIINLAILDAMECYFETKDWPTFYQFRSRHRATNPWYLRNQDKN